jgi:hypothetical protein
MSGPKSDKNGEIKMSNDNDDGLAIPEFLKISQERRRLAWAEYDLKASSLARAVQGAMAPIK